MGGRTNRTSRTSFSVRSSFNAEKNKKCDARFPHATGVIASEQNGFPLFQQFRLCYFELLRWTRNFFVSSSTVLIIDCSLNVSNRFTARSAASFSIPNVGRLVIWHGLNPVLQTSQFVFLYTALPYSSICSKFPQQLRVAYIPALNVSVLSSSINTYSKGWKSTSIAYAVLGLPVYFVIVVPQYRT